MDAEWIDRAIKRKWSGARAWKSLMRHDPPTPRSHAVLFAIVALTKLFTAGFAVTEGP